MYYALKEKSFEGMQGLGKGNITSLKDVFLIDEDLNVRYISSDGKEYGDGLKEKVLEDETKIRFSSKAFSEYVSRISGVTEDEMKFKWTKNQTKLTIADPSIETLEDLVFFPNLVELTIGETKADAPQVTDLEGIENCLKLTQLTIKYGPDKDYSALSVLDNLISFHRGYGSNSDFENIVDGVKECNKLENFTVRNSNIKDIRKIKELENLKIINLENNQIAEIQGLENMNNLEEVNLNNNKVSNLRGIENLIKLKKLQLGNNQIKDITVLSNNTGLITLDLRGNSSIEGNRANYIGKRLEDLNKIGEILDRDGEIFLDVDKLGLFTNYKKLNLASQKLTTLDCIEGMTQLQTLILKDNQLTLEDSKSQEILKSLVNLKELDLEKNEITNISAINNLTNLETLNLNFNNVNLVQIEDIISNLNNLKVTNETLSTIVKCNVNKITKLKLDNNAVLTEIPDFSTLINLKELNLRNTGIIDFTAISQIRTLESLDLSLNKLHDKEKIDFSQLINLTNLNLSNNSLWSEDLENLNQLKNNPKLTINLRNNAIVDATVLLGLQSGCKIELQGNVNLSQSSKEKLKEKFGNNVNF